MLLAPEGQAGGARTRSPQSVPLSFVSPWPRGRTEIFSLPAGAHPGGILLLRYGEKGAQGVVGVLANAVGMCCVVFPSGRGDGNR